MRHDQAQRFKFEEDLMSRKFPQFQLARGNGSVPFIPQWRPYWIGELTTREDNVYTAVIVYPENYPYNSDFHSYVLELVGRPFDQLPRHIYKNYSLCLYSNDHGGRGDGISRESTAVTVVGWVAAWLHGYEFFTKTGTWPGEGRY